MKRAAIYCRVSAADQHVESQLYDLRKFAQDRGLQIVNEYADIGISETRARRPGLDALMADARKRKFSVLLVAAFDLGRLFMTLISSIAELESDLIRERVKCGMRRARLEGRQIRRARLDVNREQVVQDRRAGLSLTATARKHAIGRATVCRLMKESACNLRPDNSGEPVTILQQPQSETRVMQ
jgi:DNA invertase Pin-like site-specific DNA recombinase